MQEFKAIIKLMFSDFFDKVYNYLGNIPFDTLIALIWGSYLAIFVAAFIANMCSGKIKAAAKRPFLWLTNAYTAVTLAAFLLKCELASSLTASLIFWVIGYILYGALCAFGAGPQKKYAVAQAAAANSIPLQPIKAAQREPQAQIPAAKSSVRLEHAIAVTDKLLTKNLAKSDRQELEKLKNTLAVLKIKGTLNPTEADILNENFNALLKLMAKYNV